eukprot:CAMPEP_0201543696 /NCGR_PEP_ID=MMETSP0161_2-20130828/72749_1 /ASSEMBLY_ACC=CAM_ASM_000251 /TAXON_ID=180227 /ORGANISM="Neoparamoeba aestuarina, Strain SoJaBio B1-5/56/2" /LENGTH=238 /DNA_ID=CAMNT_0047951519 /DNA_START=531 /DNA_END=1244 /DNA_ORIENTATION=-
MQTYLQILCLLGRHESPFFDVTQLRCSLSEDIMCDLSLPTDTLVGVLLKYGALCPLHLWKTAFCDDTLSREQLIQLVADFQNRFSLQTKVFQMAMQIELAKHQSDTPSAFWKTNEARVNAMEKSGTVDQSELMQVVEVVASSIVSKLSQNSLILASSFMLLLPLQHTFDILRRIEIVIENAQSESDIKHNPISTIFQKSSRIVGTHDPMTNEHPENLVADMAQLKQHLQRICTLCRHR